MPTPTSERQVHREYTWNYLSVRVLKSELACLLGPIDREWDGFTITAENYLTQVCIED